MPVLRGEGRRRAGDEGPRRVRRELQWAVPSILAQDGARTCRKNGLLVSAEEDVLMLFPALNISRATAQRGLDILEKSL